MLWYYYYYVKILLFICPLNLQVKSQSERHQAFICDLRTAFQKVLIWAETQIVF